ncbi:FAD-dependent oxidoreductase [Olivibacter ginsenosidimutans]|uniref:FAD-dependent oxidoreductase n=1 Tax=Olivibacter ginsenosidimutans TaxID=1176537 RepID=A0ABP9AEM4_9SPHI
MKVIKHILLIVLLALCTQQNSMANVRTYDIIVYSGSSAGFTAAIAAAKLGKKVALLEPGRHIGGMNVEGLGGTDIDNHAEFQNSGAVGGLALEFYRRIARYYHREEAFEALLARHDKQSGLWRFEPHVAQQVIDQWLSEYPIDIFYGAIIREQEGVIKKKGIIQEIRLTNGQAFQAKMFIDASLEGDLLAHAGVSTAIGREANRQYGEEHNGIRAETTHAQFLVQVDPYRMMGDSTSGLIATIQPEPLGTPGEADKHLQAYCFRMCLSKDKNNQLPFTKPADYRRSDYEIYLRYLKAGGKLYVPVVSIPNNKTDLGAWHDLSHNLYGMNLGYPEGDQQVRDSILHQHRNFTQGLFYFLAHDPEVGQLDSALQREWASWGLAKDEFTDNEGWPRQFYVRDGRRLVSDMVITENHIRKKNPLPLIHPVAIAFWPPDLHSVRRIVRKGYAYNEGFVFGGDWWRPFGIPYEALVPKAGECRNLLAPACPSSSHVAYGAIRIEFTFMELGQASGAAASLAIDGKHTVQQVPYEQLQALLLKEKAILALDTATKVHRGIMALP